MRNACSSLPDGALRAAPGARASVRDGFLLCAVLCLATPAFASSVPVLFYSSAFDYTNGNPTLGQTYSNYSPNGLSASATGSINGETVFSSSSLAGVTLRILNSGSVDPTFGAVNTAAEALLGDTITSLGATGGLNLGVNITVGGSTTSDSVSSDDTFLVVAAFTPGTFTANQFFQTPNTLYQVAYSLGSASEINPSLGLPSSITSVAGHYDDGVNTIPLSIPYATLPSSFELFVALYSFQDGNSLSWTNDYSHTLSVSLAAPGGVTLSSASGVLPGTQSGAAPEPSTVGLAGIAILACAVSLRRKKKSTIMAL